MTTTSNNNNDYSDKDIRLKPIVLFIFVTIVVTIVSVVAMKVLFDKYEASEATQSIDLAERVMQLSRPTNAVVEGLGEAAIAMKQLRAEEDAKLNHYKWVDASGGVVQIPVSRAMEVVVEKGLLPARKAD